MRRNAVHASLVALIAVVAVLSAPPAAQAAFETKAKQVIILDYATGAELYAKDADVPMHPASMTKMMTIYMLFDRLKTGSISLEDTLPVSKKAWRKKGSKMFVEVGKRIKVEDLIRGIVVQSGNDASIVVAEGLAGSEEAFAEQMTKKARELGMSSTTFRNASGWPDPDHVTTARDLAILATSTIRDFPEYYPYYAETTFTFSKIKQGNRNPLLYRNMGADGLKTGHTEEAGYGLTASAKRGERRLVMVAHGMASVRERSQETQRLLDWAFREFNAYPLFKTGDAVAEAKVWLGAEDRVPLLIEKDVVAVMKRSARKSMKVMAQFEEPVAAPITKGAKIGSLKVTAPDMPPIEYPLFAGKDVEPLGMFGRLKAAIAYLVWDSGS